MAITKLDLAIGLVEQLGMNRAEAKELVELFFEQIRLSLERGECVHLSGFGNFNLRDKKARPGRNPKTGEPYVISGRRVVTFQAGSKLKARTQDTLLHANDDASENDNE